MALPLAKASIIIDQFAAIVTEGQSTFGNTLDSFFDKFEEYWISSIGVEALSVFGNLDRISNSFQLYYGYMYSKMNEKIPTIPEFISKSFQVVLKNFCF